MAIFLKTIILFITFICGCSLSLEGNVRCALTCFCISAYIIYDMRERYIGYLRGECKDVYGKNNNQDRWDEWYNTHPQSKTYSTVKHIKNVSNIQDVKKKIKLSNNFVEFCGKKTFAVKVEDKVVEKPTIDMDAVWAEIERVEAQNETSSYGNDLVMIINDDTVDEMRTKVYDCILNVLDNPKRGANERYALLQSFVHIDICPTSIIIYVDKNILKKAKLSVSDLCETEITCALRSALYFPQLEVQFVDYKPINLLNYFLDKK